MNSLETWVALRRHWMAVIALALLGCIAGSAWAILTPREYAAGTEVFVGTDAGDDAASLAQGGTYSQQQAKNYSNVADSQVVLQPVITALGLRTTPAQLAKRVSASVPLNTSLIAIDVRDSSPVRAAAIADAVTASLTNRVQQLVPATTNGTVPIRLQVIQHATVPTTPAAPNVPVTVAVGLIAGLLAGAGAVLVRDRISTRVRTAEQAIALADAGLVGSVGFDAGAQGRPLTTLEADNSRRAEEFRQLRTNVTFIQAGRVSRSLVVTSSVPGEGKSTVSANLAISLAALGKRVCLVEADLRRPSLGGYLDLEASIGLTSVLTGEVELTDALQPWGADDLSVLLAGQLPPNPSELLSSAASQALFERLDQAFDVVIIDSPPLVPVTDASILGAAAGGVLLVVGAGRVDSRELRAARDSLATARARIHGVVLNLATAAPGHRYGRYGYDSDDRTGGTAAGAGLGRPDDRDDEHLGLRQMAG